MKQHPILGQRTQMHTRVRSHTENTQHAHAHAHAHAHTHTHTHTPEAQCPRGAPGGGRASCRGPRGLLASATPSTPCALAPAVPPWCSPQLCLVCHDCMSMPSGNTLFEACGPALVLTPAIRPKRRRAPWPAGTRQKRTHKAPVGQFRGEATSGAVLGASPVVNVSSRALGPPPPPLPEGRRGAGRQGGARQRRRVCRRRRGEGRGRAAGVGVSHGPVRRRGLRGGLVQGRRGRAAGRRS